MLALTSEKRSPAKGIKSCSARADRISFALHRMHRRITSSDAVSKSPPQILLPQPLLGANAFVRTCWMRWTSGRRSLSHCASGGTNSMRTRQPTFLRSDHSPDRSQVSFTLRWIGSDTLYAHTVYRCTPCPYVCAATKHFSSSAWGARAPCGCARARLYFNSTVTFFFGNLRGGRQRVVRLASRECDVFTAGFRSNGA